MVSDPHGKAAMARVDGWLDGGTPQHALQYAGRLQAPKDTRLMALESDLTETPVLTARMQRQPLQ